MRIKRNWVKTLLAFAVFAAGTHLTVTTIQAVWGPEAGWLVPSIVLMVLGFSMMEKADSSEDLRKAAQPEGK